METWNRKELKSNAKTALKGRYWLAFLVSFLAMVLISGSFMGGRTHEKRSEEKNLTVRFEQEISKIEEQVKDFLATDDTSKILPAIAIAAAVFVIVIIVIGTLIILLMILYAVFIGNPVVVGHKKFYLDNRDSHPEAGKLLSSFDKEYRNIVKVMFIKNLKILLWSLLLIIPGIVKAIEYFAVEYLLAEYPGIDHRRAINLSSEITKGQKWEIFKLFLSFFGWFLLCVATGGIGFVFLNPYIQATFAELYSVLTEKTGTESLIENEDMFDEEIQQI